MKELEEILKNNKVLHILAAIRNSITLICFTILAIVFNNFWIVFGSILFWGFVGKEED
jgi:hypothetical protein